MKVRTRLLLVLAVSFTLLVDCQKKNNNTETVQPLITVNTQINSHKSIDLQQNEPAFILVSSKYIATLISTMNHYSAIEKAQEGNTPAFYSHSPKSKETIAIWNFHEGGEALNQTIGENGTVKIGDQIYNKVDIDIDDPQALSHYVASIFLKNAIYANENIELIITDGVIKINGIEYLLELDIGAGYNREHMNMLYRTGSDTNIGTDYVFCVLPEAISLYEIKYEDSPVALISDNPIVLKRK